MKTSKVKNSFSPEIRLTLQEAWKCWLCSSNKADTLHHILGRKRKSDASILNAAPLCNHKCHLPNHGKLMTKKGQKEMLDKTLNYLQEIEYKFNDLDRDFIETNKEFYL